MEIKNTDGVIIFDTDNDNIKDAVEEAVKSGANLFGANLGGANLRYADLRYADLSGANLFVANLRYADLSGANLRYADLNGANLSGAKLSGADLRYADLIGANLFGANLFGANLRYADLSGADLRYADLSGANLRYADLSGAKLSEARNIPFVPLACPSDGEFTGWKKVQDKLIELRIPAEAKRSSATTEKCRCEKALVVAITDIDTGDAITEIVNCNHTTTIYRVGDTVFSDSFDDNRWNECSNGIHFFINKESAINY